MIPIILYELQEVKQANVVTMLDLPGVKAVGHTCKCVLIDKGKRIDKRLT
jgi:hypothetical protein